MTATPPVELRKVTEKPAFPNPSASLNKLINRFQPSPETVVLLLAILIGGGTGMGIVTFHYLIQFFHHLLLEDLMSIIGKWGAWTLACVPSMGGLIVGLMRWRTEDFGPGLASLIAASQKGELKQQLRPVTKMLAASVSLGSGASLGPEGPSVEIGGNLGILMSQVLQVSQERQRLLLGAGAAAGIAAGFNAPIAGVFFALEVVLGGTSFASSAVSVVVLASVVSALVAQIVLGGQPAFTLPVYQVRSSLELPLYLGLGVGASLISLAYTQTVSLCKAFFRSQLPGTKWVSVIPKPLHPIIGGIIVGIVALKFPQILGIGYGTIQGMLQGAEFSLELLLSLIVVKLLMTAVSAGSGLVGGLFAPAMFLGASYGGAYAQILTLVAPKIASQMAAPPAYAMVGMAAVLAASVRAPLTSILLLFELTRDYRIILPLMAAVGISFWLVERLKPTDNPNTNLQQIGLSVLKDQQADILQQIKVEDAMQGPPKKLAATMKVLEAGLEMTGERHRSALVIDENNQLVGIVTLEDINRTITLWQEYANSQSQPPTSLLSQTIRDISTTEILYAYTDETVSEALDRMALRGLNQLPVVAKNNQSQILGLLEREQIDFSCNLAVTRKALRHFLPAAPKTNVAISQDEPVV